MDEEAEFGPKRSGYTAIELALAIGATILVTLILMALSGLSGGFAAGDPVSGLPSLAERISIPIAIHLATVMPAIPLGAYILWAKKGDATHKLLGRIWGMLMLTTAIASLFIGRPGTGIAGTGFSFIHAFSFLTLFSVPYGVWAVRKGNVLGHYRSMQGVYIGLIIAGLFSFIPGRILGTLIFG